MSVNQDNRIQWLDVFRGIAILLVVLFHFTVRYGEKYPIYVFRTTPFLQVKFGWIGVYLFFMISGFIIYLTIQNKKGFLDFMVARLSRLMPPYWAAISLILLLEYLHSYLFNMPLRNNAGNTILNLFMIPDIFHARFLDGAFWSLFVEIKFYFLFGILWQFVNLKKKSMFYLSYGILFIFANIHDYLHKMPLGDNFNYFLVFWLGIAAFKFLREDLSWWEYSFLTSLTAISTVGLYRDGIELLIGIPFFSLLFAFIEEYFKKYSILKILFLPVASLGRFSYSFYLIHQPIGYLVLGMLSISLLSYNFSVFVSLLICSGVAWLGYWYIERLDKSISFLINRKIDHLARKAEIYP